MVIFFDEFVVVVVVTIKGVIVVVVIASVVMAVYISVTLLEVIKLVRFGNLQDFYKSLQKKTQDSLDNG